MSSIIIMNIFSHVIDIFYGISRIELFIKKWGHAKKKYEI